MYFIMCAFKLYKQQKGMLTRCGMWLRLQEKNAPLNFRNMQEIKQNNKY